MTIEKNLQTESMGVYMAASSLISAVVAGTACIGPLAGIALGIGGLGWLSQFAYLSLPAGILSLVLLILALLVYYRRKSSCVSRRRHNINRLFLAFSVMAVIAINLIEFVIVPNLG